MITLFVVYVTNLTLTGTVVRSLNSVFINIHVLTFIHKINYLVNGECLVEKPLQHR